MTKEKYLEMCRVLKQEPDTELMPIDFQDFPLYIQELFELINILPDKWDGMSGAYLGKDLTILPYLLDLYEIENHKLAIRIIMIIVGENARLHNEKVKQKTDQAKAKKKK